MLKLTLQYFGQERCKELTHLKRPWCWERVKAEGEGDNRGWDGWMASPTWMDMSLSKLRELVMDRKAFVCCSPWGRKELDTTEQLNWTDRWVSITIPAFLISFFFWNCIFYFKMVIYMPLHMVHPKHIFRVCRVSTSAIQVNVKKNIPF